MTRMIALRVSAVFVVLTILFGAIGLGSHAALAEAMFLISASICALMLFFGVAIPDRAAVPVHVRRLPPRR